MAHSLCLSQDSRHSYSVGLFTLFSSHDCSCTIAPRTSFDILALYKSDYYYYYYYYYLSKSTSGNIILLQCFRYRHTGILPITNKYKHLWSEVGTVVLWPDRVVGPRFVRPWFRLQSKKDRPVPIRRSLAILMNISAESLWRRTSGLWPSSHRSLWVLCVVYDVSPQCDEDRWSGGLIQRHSTIYCR